MKVKIKQWNAVATWRWDIPEDDVCGICQVHFDGTCPTCKYPGDDCSLCKSACSPSISVRWVPPLRVPGSSRRSLANRLYQCLENAAITFTCKK
ncbi:anaphase-promoting complex subunit 11 [Magnaporthiopsis poae ATCC 64411]|uniref:Anaphase-promoting complex subunit 11 n=1 Tax=Magnaporthiopsis poae (strain ATCC 64411 / 73-15) TaxID=644358 RepID=A0A0C4E5V4_MAGP6|nr:anaphase-promoting complex subunit 11 [Magnaporthiopsis poae ATCC 64411]